MLSLSSALSFVVAVAVLGAELSFVGAMSSCMGGGGSFAGGVRRSYVRGLWLSYTGGVVAVMGH